MAPPIVKVISKTGRLDRQKPRSGVWEGITYTFAPDADRYDWLVVYDDLPGLGKLKINAETLSCVWEKTILHTHEPAAVKIHGSDFCKQFATVISCHPDKKMRHPNKITMHPASPWWYDYDSDYEDFVAQKDPPPKPRLISTLCSTKQQKHTLHHRRYRFTQAVKRLLPEMDWFGQGIRPVSDKREALDDYRYHLTVENDVEPHYWTEKLADTFLAFALPFYHGCPNIEHYFPPDSLILVDIGDPEGTAKRIRRAVEENEWQRRLPAIMEARQRLLNQHNFFSVISRFIHQNPEGCAPNLRPRRQIVNRRRLVLQNPVAGVRYLAEKIAHRRSTAVHPPNTGDQSPSG